MDETPGAQKMEILIGWELSDRTRVLSDSSHPIRISNHSSRWYC